MKLFDATLGRLLQDTARRQPDKEFIIYPDRNLRFSYRDFELRVGNLAKGLLALGLEKGDHLGIWAGNVPDWLTFMFATARIGVVLVTINTAYKTRELDYLIRQADLRALCLVDGCKDGDYVGMVYELIPELKEQERGRLASARYPRLEKLIFIGPEKHRGMYSTPEILLLGSHISDDRLREAEAGLSCHDVINMQYTSGTTGFPKGVMLSHYNILNNGFYIGEAQAFGAADRLCLPVPLFHCFGCVLGVLAILTHGGTLVLLESFDPLLVLASVQQERCTALYGVPTMFIAELNHPMFGMFDLTSLRTGIMAGSPCPLEIMKRVIGEMHCREITIAYGLTEASPVITQTRIDDPLELRVATVGQALPGIEAKVVHPESGRECPPGVPGEIFCRGYNVMQGYYNLPEETGAAVDEQGWLHSGDLGTRDEAGYFRITGRIKDMIIRGGENIYPREVEEFLYGLPEVKDVQVVGVPDERYGEEVCAFIIPRPESGLSAEDIRDACRGKISRHKIPRHVFFVDAYPLTASGKIRKYKLSEQAARLLGSEASGAF